MKRINDTYYTNQAALIRLMLANGMIRSESEYAKLYSIRFRTLYNQKGKVTLADFNCKI